MEVSVPDRLLSVDLDAREVEYEDLPTQWIRTFVGGKGLGARYLYEAIGPETDPRSPENVLLLLVGPLTGYLPDGGRFAAVTKSPLTGLFLDSYAGGSFGPALRAAFPDTAGIVLKESATECCVLDLRGGEPEVRAAPELAGATTDAVDEAYPDASVLCVGPAGEHGVGFATIAVDGGEHHAGRGGAGTVMGGKGLKAVLLDDVEPTEVPSTIEALQEETREAFASSAYGESYRASGTLESVDFADALSMLPARGWQDRTFEGTEEIGADAIEAHARGREDPDDAFPGDFRVQVGEYETVIRGGTPIALGAGLGLADVDVVSKLGAACDRLGLDVISTGNAIAMAILASEAGTIDRELSFGDEESIRGLLHEIGTRSTRLGDTLADGVETAASALDLEGAIPTVKAMAVPSFDPRGAPAVGLSYATSDRGACHRRGVPATTDAFRAGLTPSQVAEAVVEAQDRRALHWCLIVDDVADPMLGDLGRRWLEAIGLSLGREELGRVGPRTWTMTRLFNVREGVDQEADDLPSMFREGAAAIDQTAFARARSRYYELREWDRRGIPSRRLLDRLDLIDVVDAKTPVGGHPLRGTSAQ